MFFAIVSHYFQHFSINCFSFDSYLLKLPIFFFFVDIPINIKHWWLHPIVRFHFQQLLKSTQILQTQIGFLLTVQQSGIHDCQLSTQSNFFLVLIFEDAPKWCYFTSDECHERWEVDVVDTFVDKVKVTVVCEGMTDKDKVTHTVKLVVSFESLVHDGTVLWFEKSLNSLFFNIIVNSKCKSWLWNEAKYLFGIK